MATYSLEDEDKPASISHYTTLEGLKGIITSGRLWASNASFLNDKAELSHALRAARGAIQKLSSAKSMAELAPVLKKVISEFEDGGVPDTYVTCFCRSADNLSQWRGYGGAVQGISLTFDRMLLTKRLQKDRARFFKVRYSKVSTASKLSTALSKEVKDFAEVDELLSMSPNETYDDMRRRVSGLLPQFKHLGFQDEKEWRYAIQRNVVPDAVFFRVANNKIVPYIEIGISKSLLPITAARIGPGPDQELTMQSVKLFLHAKGYDIPVTMSEVPYRP